MEETEREREMKNMYPNLHFPMTEIAFKISIFLLTNIFEV